MEYPGKALSSAIAVCLLAVSSAVLGQDGLEQGFQTPPDSAKPRTWWHWTKGNVTEDGITKDLEWMKRSGIGGFQLVDVAAGGGQEVQKKIEFGTADWYHAVLHSAEEAKRLGLEMSIFSSPGWSEAGGPWIKPQQAMKKLVWSETIVEGQQSFSGQLTEPPSNEGPVRNLSVGAHKPDAPHFYRDNALIAYRLPTDEVAISSLHPKVTTDAGTVDATALFDGSLNTSITVPAPANGGPAWLQFEFAQPYHARALTIGSRGGIPVGRILASDDGVNFRTIVVTPGPQGYHGASVRTFAFPEVTARFFRIELDGAGLRPAAVIHGGKAIPAAQYTLTEAILYSGARVNRWEDKGTFGSLMDVYEVAPTPNVDKTAEIAREDVIDLTGKMDQGGTLHWNVPEGKWVILRMGYSLTGAKNRPATPAGLGYEVDKLSAKHVQEYFDGYMDPLRKHLGGLMGSTLQYMTMDSWEAGMQNWTEEMIPEFRRRRGYDPVPYLPVLAGHVVQSAEISDRFLWDFRRTLADMFADNFYGTMEHELQQQGMRSYAEASGVALEIPEDTLLNKSKVDIPMAEFWVHALHPESMYYVDVRGAASAAHVYGKPIVAAEAFTGGGYESPYTLKKVADYWFAQGVNRLVFHSTAHQPLDTKPGNTMVGTHINRNMTWAEQAKPFMTYLSRVQYLLQQGSQVADIAYLLPEGAPSTMPFWGAGLEPAPPEGYDYDYLNTDVLLHRTSVGPNGRVKLADGMSYRVLVLTSTTQMTPEVLNKIHQLVVDGATILGPRPAASPSLQRYPQADSEVQAMATDLWGDMDGVTNIQHAYGKGMVYWGLPLKEVLNRLDDAPDFAASNCSPGAEPVWIHRHTDDADIYFIANQADAPQTIEARFRVSGKDVQLWNPMSGQEAKANYVSHDGFTTVRLNLAERESVFVVFRGAATTPSRVLPAVTERKLASIEGPWQVSFPAGWGAPSSIRMDKLSSWTDSAQEGVKYFSGTATYRKSVQVRSEWLHAGSRIYLDLGKVRDIAEVSVNNKPVGITWAPPYRMDVTDVLKPGLNTLEIKVTNEWTNRRIGDRSLPADKRILAASEDRMSLLFGGPQQPLESGLLGDVSLVAN